MHSHKKTSMSQPPFALPLRLIDTFLILNIFMNVQRKMEFPKELHLSSCIIYFVWGLLARWFSFPQVSIDKSFWTGAKVGVPEWVDQRWAPQVHDRYLVGDCTKLLFLLTMGPRISSLGTLIYKTSPSFYFTHLILTRPKSHHSLPWGTQWVLSLAHASWSLVTAPSPFYVYMHWLPPSPPGCHVFPLCMGCVFCLDPLLPHLRFGLHYELEPGQWVSRR